MSEQKVAVGRALRAQRARQMAGLPTAGFFGDLFNVGKKIVGAIIPGAGLAIDIAEGVLGGGEKAPTVAPMPLVSMPPPAPVGCPTGFHLNPSTGQCEKTGLVGAVQRFIPGGATGTAVATSTGFREAVIGAFGRPALVPATSTGITRRCPRGAFLGTDNLCYEKLPREFRKWKPAKKPPISAKDWTHLQVAERVRTKSKRIATAAGFTCRKK